MPQHILATSNLLLCDTPVRLNVLWAFWLYALREEITGELERMTMMPALFPEVHTLHH